TRRPIQVQPQGPAPQMPNIPEDSPFYEFFKRFFENQPGQPGRPPQPRGHSLGSGFIISQDGYILTNAHVVNNADDIVVRFADQREMTAELIGLDERTDVALLKVEGEDLPTVTLGNPEQLEVGEWVLAIGSPFGLEMTATAGIVSALGRNLPSDTYVPFIQTDVAVNPGNSGGPLFNTQGQVVGINSQIFSTSGGYMGLSFAIPIDVAMDVARQIQDQGFVTRGWLGVRIQGIDQELAQSFGLQRPRGALVAEVIPESPAAQAGLQVGDIILSFNDRQVEEWAQLPGLVGRTQVGETVPVQVLRDGQQQTIEVTIEALDEEPTRMASAPRGERGVLGVAVSDLNAAQREELGLAEERGGVLIENVEEGPAMDAGVRPGDVILQLNRQKVENVRQFAELVEQLPRGQTVPLLIYRDGSPTFRALRIPAEE
ncbi:MAG: DegQ family serine endoprotease, partial [Candidatus Competibacteraceae bacterium]|nr:DegQ family serine endoprotease [Candidatus Competibacteraceae bacterium]